MRQTENLVLTSRRCSILGQQRLLDVSLSVFIVFVLLYAQYLYIKVLHYWVLLWLLSSFIYLELEAYKGEVRRVPMLQWILFKLHAVIGVYAAVTAATPFGECTFRT